MAGEDSPGQVTRCRCSKLAVLVVLAAGSLLVAACASSVVVDASQGTDDGADPAATELMIEVQQDVVEGIPPWEEFRVELGQSVTAEQVTAVGDPLDDGSVLLGSSCEELLADNPALTGCVEEVDEFSEVQNNVDIGPLDSDGTLVTSSPEVDSELSIFAVSTTDDSCAFTGRASLSAGQTSAVVLLELECA